MKFFINPSIDYILKQLLTINSSNMMWYLLENTDIDRGYRLGQYW